MVTVAAARRSAGPVVFSHDPHGRPSGGAWAPSGPGQRPQALRSQLLKTPGARGRAVPQSLRLGCEVKRLRCATSETFLASKGRMLTKVFPAPVNYRTASGAFAPMNNSLVASGTGFQNAANSFTAKLPATAGAPVHMSFKAKTLSLALKGARGKGIVSGSVERFPSALTGKSPRLRF